MKKIFVFGMIVISLLGCSPDDSSEDCDSVACDAKWGHDPVEHARCLKTVCSLQK